MWSIFTPSFNILARRRTPGQTVREERGSGSLALMCCVPNYVCFSNLKPYCFCTENASLWRHAENRHFDQILAANRHLDGGYFFSLERSRVLSTFFSNH